MKTQDVFYKGRAWHWLTMLIIFVIVLWGAYAPSLAIGEVKTRLSMGTDKIGSLFNALGNGYAKVISQYSKITVVVRPFTGADAWLPALDKGEIELGSISSGLTWYPYNAIGTPYSTPLRNLRLLRSV